MAVIILAGAGNRQYREWLCGDAQVARSWRLRVAGFKRFASHRSRVERVDMTITTTLQALYDAWAARYFGSAAILADPDKDGVPNLAERAQGTDPTKNNTRLETNGPVKVNGQDYLSFTYWKANDASDVSATPEITADLTGAWVSGPANLVEMENVDEGNDLRRIKVRDAQPISSTKPKAFIRLNVSALRP